MAAVVAVFIARNVNRMTVHKADVWMRQLLYARSQGIGRVMQLWLQAKNVNAGQGFIPMGHQGVRLKQWFTSLFFNYFFL
jgi:hypothetical protein